MLDWRNFSEWLSLKQKKFRVILRNPIHTAEVGFAAVHGNSAGPLHAYINFLNSRFSVVKQL